MKRRQPPENSKIIMEEGEGCTRFKWPNLLPPGALDISILVFITIPFGIGMLVYSLIWPIKQLVNHINDGITPNNVIAVCWIAAIFVVGIGIARWVRVFLRPRPAILEVSDEQIVYETGTRRPRFPMEINSGNNKRKRWDSGDMGLEKNKKYLARRGELHNLNLERTDTSLTLTVDFRKQTVEIGAGLADTDKEFLYEVLASCI